MSFYCISFLYRINLNIFIPIQNLTRNVHKGNRDRVIAFSSVVLWLRKYLNANRNFNAILSREVQKLEAEPHSTEHNNAVKSVRK